MKRILEDPFLKKNTAVAGTLILAAAGLATRLIGFIYRILMSRWIGSEGMGLFGLISPVYGFTFTLCGSGVYMAVSKLVAEARTDREATRLVLPSLLLTVSLSAAAMLSLQFLALPLGTGLLGDVRTVRPLRLISLALPFCAAGNCFKAYFLGVRRMAIPAVSQILEQLAHMGVIGGIALLSSPDDLEAACMIVVLGNVAGDLFSCLLTATAYGIVCKKQGKGSSKTPAVPFLAKLLGIAFPLTVNRAIGSGLSGFENIIIPKVLVRSGMSSTAALSAYGELNGMAFPIIFFPTLLTGALSNNLLPIVSSAHASGSYKRLQRAIEQSLRLTLYMGLFFGLLFALGGNWLGRVLYDSASAGHYIVLLSVVCPFFYLQSVLGGLMNGLDLQNDSLVHTVLCDGIRILILLFIVPSYGFNAFIAGLLGTNILLSLLNLRSLLRVAPVRIRVLRLLAPPSPASLRHFLPARSRQNRKG